MNDFVMLPDSTLLLQVPSDRADPKVARALSHDDTAQRAYEIYVATGGVHGHCRRNWFEAERQLRDEAAAARTNAATSIDHASENRHAESCAGHGGPSLPAHSRDMEHRDMIPVALGGHHANALARSNGVSAELRKAHRQNSTDSSGAPQ